MDHYNLIKLCLGIILGKITKLNSEEYQALFQKSIKPNYWPTVEKQAEEFIMDQLIKINHLEKEIEELRDRLYMMETYIRKDLGNEINLLERLIYKKI